MNNYFYRKLVFAKSKSSGTSNYADIDNLTITENENGEIQAVGVLNDNDKETLVKLWIGTKEEYDAIEEKDDATLYNITDDYEEPEIVANKTTIIDANSTDTQYPSAKAVYDIVQNGPGAALDNVIPKQTAIDSIININDALKYKTFNFKVDGAYEQNGEPTPEAPIPITTLNFNKITKVGQNLYNVRDAYTGGFNSYNSAYQVDEDDWITLNIQGAPSDYNYYSLYTNNLRLKPETYYNIVLEVKEKSGLGTLSIVSQKIEGETQVEGQFNGSFSNTFGSLGPGIYTKKLKTLNKEELENTVAGLRTFILLDKGNYSSITFRISVIEDTSVTPENFVYQPYQETNYLIDLQDNEMVSLPNGVKDELQIDKEGNVSLIKNIGKILLNDVEKWNLIGDTDTYWEYANYNLSDSAKYSYCLSNYFSSDEDNRLIYTLTQIYCRFPKSLGIDVSDVDKFKQWITSNEVYGYYEKTTPQTISLGKLSDIIKTEKGSNTFAINGNIDTNISTTYALDLKKYIDNKISTVSQAVIEQE